MKKLTVTTLFLIIMMAGCGLPDDPVLDDFYTRNVYPGTADTYSVGSEEYPYSEGWFNNLTLTDDLPITLEGDALVWLEFRPDIDFETVRANGKPTWVKRGIVGGWSLPPNAANEEIYMELHAPNRWDEESDVYVHVHCYLDTANTDKNFNMELSWTHITDGDIIPDTSTVLTTETATGVAVQYTQYHVDFILAYDVDPADLLQSSDEIHIRLRRINASANEAAGEVVVTHIGVVFRRDKLGAETP